MLDLKDKRILKELFVDGRMPLSVIAKKVQLSKEVVHYRVNRMIKEGLLLRINSVYDIQRLGWKIFLVYVRLKSVDNEKEKQIIDTLKNHPNIAWVTKCIGSFDLVVKFFVKDNIGLNLIMKRLEEKFEIDDYKIDFMEKEHLVPLPFLYAPVKPDQMIEKRGKGIFKPEKIDLKILEQLAHNSRMQITDIAKNINESREKVKYHLKKLEKEKIILKYRPSAWSGSKSIGYSWYLVLLKLKKLDKQKRNTLISFIANHPNMTYYYEMIGENDFGFEIRLKTGDELNEILMKIRSILGEDLKRHDLSLILKEYKYTYFPECLKNT